VWVTVGKVLLLTVELLCRHHCVDVLSVDVGTRLVPVR
jgi:hypothetical protein